jgi:hypothetical protein
MRLFAALLTLLVITSASQAQTQRKETPIYRCGPEGKDLRDAPCPAGGAADTVQFDQPSNADARAARERQQADAREAKQLEKERKAQEARDLKANARATVIGPQSPASAASAASPTKKAPKAPKRPKAKAAKPAEAGKLDAAQAPAANPALGPKPQR